jgi:hypothetical protein
MKYNKVLILSYFIKIIIFIVAVFSLAACATTKIPQATGGSKADGIVEMSYIIFGETKVSNLT